MSSDTRKAGPTADRPAGRPGAAPARRPQARPNPLRSRVWNAGRLLVLVAALAVTFGAFFLTAMRVATRAREVKVPDLRGKSVSEAGTTLTRVGLILKVDPTRRPDAKVPADHILTQDPDPGTSLRRQRTVRVHVSDGQRDPIVPSVVGQPERTAEITLAQAHVQVGSRSEIKSTNLEKDTVVSQDPFAPGRASTVALLINRAEGGPSYVMPDLIGALSSRAIEILRARGFRVTTTGEATYPGVPPGLIIRQTPQAGYQITPADLISVEVSR